MRGSDSAGRAWVVEAFSQIHFAISQPRQENLNQISREFSGI
jgi:hypothetical protein